MKHCPDICSRIPTMPGRARIILFLLRLRSEISISQCFALFVFSSFTKWYLGHLDRKTAQVKNAVVAPNWMRQDILDVFDGQRLCRQGRAAFPVREYWMFNSRLPDQPSDCCCGVAAAYPARCSRSPTGRQLTKLNWRLNVRRPARVNDACWPGAAIGIASQAGYVDSVESRKVGHRPCALREHATYDA